ncbi:4Fe-4S binding protein [Halanaerocella petrolearia]
MAKREIVKIDEDKCNGCGECITGCHEGALQIVDGVAKLVNEEFCDGFGDCIGECPTGALTIEEREAKEFDIEATKDHVKELRGEEAVEEMMKAQEEHADEEDTTTGHNHSHAGHTGGCPGSRMRMMNKTNTESTEDEVEVESQLEQWPVQIHLVPPTAPYFKNADLLVTADCVPAAYGNYHQKMLKGRAVAMGCPKLDDAQAYVDKLAAIIKENDLNSITVARMEVPCCGGLVRIAEQAIQTAGSDLDLEVETVGINGKLK